MSGGLLPFIKELLYTARANLRLLRSVLRARRREAALYASMRQLSEAEWEAYAQRIRTLCQQRDYSSEWTQVWETHRYRLYLTVRWLQELPLRRDSLLQAAELGGVSIVSDLLRQEFPAWEWRNTQGDLRQRLEFEDSSLDLLVATEVLEHLADLPQGFNDSFEGSGVRALLCECRRVLKPGGMLFITTPNAASVIHVQMALLGKPPWFYQLHVREYTAEQLVGLVQEAGFEVLRCEAVHCLTVDMPFDHRRVLQALDIFGYPLEGRGDDLFLAARSLMH